MKRVGILTFHRANNYGALLQAYALKFFLLKMKYNAKIINYLSYSIENEYKFFSHFENFGMKWIINKCIKLLLLPFICYCNFKFKNFRKQFLTDTIEFFDKDLEKQKNEFDLVITGSDQVFNIRKTNFDKSYFLDFVKVKDKCFSYAASFGLEYESLTEEEKIFIKQNLQNFNCLSLREQEGLNIVKKLSNIKAEIHIDPTLLLNREDWIKISKIPKEKNFVLIYLINSNNKIIEYANKLAKSKNLKIKIITSKIKELILNRNTFVSSPQEWLGYFLNAKYIVTNSFHGLAFSINFNKQFFVDFIPNNKLNSRIENLLSLTNLKDRLIDNIGTEYDKPINWDCVNSIVEKEREKSNIYLSKICGKG